MKILRAAVMIALLAGPAYAQKPIPRYGETDAPAKTPQEIEKDKATEKAYNNSLGNIPDKTPTDPWGNVRSTSAPKADVKASAKADAKPAPAKPRTKTGSTAN